MSGDSNQSCSRCQLFLFYRCCDRFFGAGNFFFAGIATEQRRMNIAQFLHHCKWCTTLQKFLLCLHDFRRIDRFKFFYKVCSYFFKFFPGTQPLQICFDLFYPCVMFHDFILSKCTFVFCNLLLYPCVLPQFLTNSFFILQLQYTKKQEKNMLS